jgi:hypothetical protein
VKTLALERYPVVAVLQVTADQLFEKGHVVGYFPTDEFVKHFDDVFSLSALAAVRKKNEPTPAPTGTALDDEGLAALLNGLGYQPEVKMFPTGGRYYQLAIKQADWTYDIRAFVNANRTELWLTSPLAYVPRDQATTSEVLRLLADNEQIGGAHFAYNSATRMLALHRSIANRGITPVQMRTELEEFMTTIRRTQPLWEPSMWPKPQALRP